MDISVVHISTSHMVSFRNQPTATRLVIIILVLPVTCFSFYTSFNLRHKTNFPTVYLQPQDSSYEERNILKSIFNDTNNNKIKSETESWDDSIGALLSTSSPTADKSITEFGFLPESPQNNDKFIARTILIIVSAFYGTNFGCVKILNENLDPSVAAALRFSLVHICT